jgi:hypothetical protein
MSPPTDRSGVIDTLFPYEEALTDFLVADPVVERLPMLSRWDPFGRPYHHGGGELETIIAEVEQARACVQDSDTALMLGKSSWLARRALAEGLVMTLLPD